MSLVGFSARNHPQQAVRDTVDDRRTPRGLFDQIHAQHHFTLDAAASDDNALLPNYHTRITDGLLRTWSGERVWCNPPFSRLEPWLAKAWRAMTDENAELVVMLLPANRTEQRFWHEWVEPFRDSGGGGNVKSVFLRSTFLPRRVEFDYPPGVKNNRSPMFGCVLLTWRREP